jgi:spore photoproduct lyase
MRIVAEYVPARAFFEPAALDYPLGRTIHDRLKNLAVPITFTGSHNRVTGLPGKTPAELYREAKRTLVVGVRKSAAFAACRPSADYQLPLATSCPGMCEYCYLATTLGRRPYLRVYVNIGEILARAQAYMDSRAPKVTVFEGAATADPLPTEYLTGLLGTTIEYFGSQPLGRFRFVTKYDTVDTLLTAAHNGHTRFRFSLNAPTIISRYEHATPDLEARMAAAAKVAGAGYPLGFIIAPIFHYPGWRQEYGGLVERLAAALPPAAGDDLTFELITHRFTKRAKANITAVFPATSLPLAEEERRFKFGQFGYGKYIYDNETMAEIKAFMNERLTKHFPAAKIEYLV